MILEMQLTGLVQSGEGHVDVGRIGSGPVNSPNEHQETPWDPCQL